VKPDISAPGVNITSAQAGTTNGYVTESGTSMATPFVAGVALLMLDASPTLTPQQIKDKMKQTAIDWGRGGNNQTPGSTGNDIDYGAGRLDAYAALQAAGAYISSPPAVPTHELREGTLSGSGARVDYPIEITDTRFPIAATLIVSGLTGRLYLFNPSGTQVASSARNLRQEDLGYKPTIKGTYTLRVSSLSGSGSYFVDISRSKTVSYEHPIGASPLRVPLVPAYGGCGAAGANSTHGTPLNFASCNPPIPASSTARLGSQSIGFATVLVCDVSAVAANCNEAGFIKPDLRLFANIRDVRCRTSVPAGCSPDGDYNPNAGQGPYTTVCTTAASCSGGDKAAPRCALDTNPAGGTSETNCIAGTDITEIVAIPGATMGGQGTKFQGRGVRITDTYNGTTRDAPGTVADIGFPIPIDCLSTPDPSLGSSCGVNTSANALTPGAVRDGDSAVWELGEIELADSGADGVRGNADDQVLATQGIYLP
jgi:hypothetical protein